MSGHKEINYRFVGENQQTVEFVLQRDEGILADAGSMLYMDPSITMEPRYIKNIPLTDFVNSVGGRGIVSFTAMNSGQMIDIDLSSYGGSILCRKDVFICMSRTLTMSAMSRITAFFSRLKKDKELDYRISGKGMVFIYGSGKLLKKSLGSGDSIKVAMDSLIAMTDMVTVESNTSGFVRAAGLGSSQLYLSTVKGPGTIWLQTSRKEGVTVHEAYDPLEELSDIADMFTKHE